MFQDYALFPHLSVRANVAFGLGRLLRPLCAADARRVDELLEVFGLTAMAGSRPADLSGGQRQRTALARALAAAPHILLLDEPFSALDQPLRLRMRQEVARLLDHFGIPLVLVTHDPREAEIFAGTIVVYDQGVVQEVLPRQEMEAQGRPLRQTLCDRARQACEPETGLRAQPPAPLEGRLASDD